MPLPRGRAYIDWTQGSIPLNLLKLSWPMIVGSSLNMLGPLIDVIWVGKLGSAAVAGVGVAGIAVQMVMSAMMGMVTGMRALIARYMGAGDLEMANHVATQAMFVSTAVSVVMAVVGFFIAAPILRLMGLQPDVVSEGAAYLRIVFLSAIPMSLRFMAEGSMQAAGDSMRPMIITAAYRAVHVLFCPFLVLGLWIFPKMGVSGAAWMNMISQTIGLVLAMWVLFTGRTRLRLDWQALVGGHPAEGGGEGAPARSRFHVDKDVVWRLAKIGFPSSIMGVQMSLGAFIMIRLLSPFGTTAVAAHAIWARVDMMLMMPIMGLGMGAGVLAGQNLGAGHPERAVRSGWIAAFIAQGFLLVAAGAITLWAEPIVRVFNSEPAVVTMAASFLRIATVMYLVFAMSPVLQNCVAGAGDTVPPMVIALIGTWVIQLPLAFLLPRLTDLGVNGIRWAMVVTAYLGTIAFTLYFVSGRWRHKGV